LRFKKLQDNKIPPCAGFFCYRKDHKKSIGNVPEEIITFETPISKK